MKQRLKWHLENQYYRYIQFQSIYSKKYSHQDNIIIAGSPRSGTTWLAELLANIPNTAHLDEPLKPTSSNYVKNRLGLGWYPSVLDGGHLTKHQKLFFDRLFRGAFYNPNILFNSNDIQLPKVELWLLKFVRLNMLLPWVIDNFNVRKPIYVIRNPYAVMASQLRHPGWANVPWESGFQKGEVYSHIAEKYKHYLGSLNSREEFLITLWCLENKFLLEHPYHSEKKWHFTSYEYLVMQPQEALDALATDLKLSLPQQVIDSISKPSYSVVEGNLKSDPIKQLAKWREQLSAHQVDIISGVLSRFEIDIYSFDDDTPII